MRVLIIEDRETYLHHLVTQLGNMGYTVDGVTNTKKADLYLKDCPPDVVVLDLALPGEDGLSMIQRWRNKKINIPILVVTVSDSWQKKVTVLNAGADDYVVKECNPAELHARIQALLRRQSGFASQIIEIAPFLINITKKEFSINSHIVKLTSFEFTIMETLMRNNGKVVSKKLLIRELYKNKPPKDHTIDVVMGRLRKKILNEWPEEVIVTIRSQGYLLNVKSHDA